MHAQLFAISASSILTNLVIQNNGQIQRFIRTPKKTFRTKVQKNHTIQKWFHCYQNLGYLVIRLICANTLSSGSRSERQTKSAEISFLQNCLNIAQSAKNEGAKITKKTLHLPPITNPTHLAIIITCVQ